MKERPWYQGSGVNVVEALNAAQSGLSQNEALVRLNDYGLNKLPEKRPDGWFLIFLRQFQSSFVYILLLSGVILLFLGESADAAIIFVVLIANAIVGLIQEGKAQNALAALKKFSITESTALRDGKEMVVEDAKLVPGDIVVLREGDKIPADCRLLEARDLRVNESALTGESEPVTKEAGAILSGEVPVSDQVNMVFKGTFVTSGNARAIVVATGVETEIGKISKELALIDSEVPLKKSFRKLSHLITIFVLIANLILFVVGLWQGQEIGEMFFTVVAVAVSIIPEGLPIVVTLVLALGVFRMGKRNALVKRLQAVEALGQADVIAVDKTGTITQNELVVEEVYVDGKFFTVESFGYEPKGEVLLDGISVNPADHAELLLIGKHSILTSTARLRYIEDEDDWSVSGDPTEASMLVFGKKIGFDREALLHEYQPIQEIPFSTERGTHVVVHENGPQHVVSIAGIPEVVVRQAKYIYEGGKKVELSENHRRLSSEILNRLSQKGLRVIAVATSEHPNKISAEHLPEFTLIGFVGIKDSLRPNVAQAVREATENGIRVVMITGDHVKTAQIVAEQAGIFKQGDEVVSGEEFSKMSDQETSKRLMRISVFARVTPQHKLKIVRAYKKMNLHVAMTGDGVNDALSLAEADLGIGMGKSGTEVAKEASDIVLLDDNFTSIVAAVEEGRGIVTSIKRVILFLFSTNISEFLVIFVAIAIGLPLPILPTQILWLNLVTDGLLDAAIGFDPHEKLLRSRKTKSGFLIDKLMLGRMTIMSLVMTVGTLFVFIGFYKMDLTKGYTMALTTLAFFQWFNIWNCRSEIEPFFRQGYFVNRFLAVAAPITILLQLFAVYNPFMQKILHTTALSLSEWGLVILVASLVVVVEEIRKFIVRLKTNAITT